MAVSLQVDLTDHETSTLFNTLSHLGSSVLSSTMQEIGEAVRSLAVEAFESEQTPEGEDWQQSIRAAEEGGQTLSDTAILRNSISVHTTKTSTEVGSNIVYAAIHQLGGEAGPKDNRITLGARAYLPDPDGSVLRVEIMDIVKAQIMRAFQ